MAHDITDARWTPRVNMLVVRCSGSERTFEIRSDRWKVACPHCGKVGRIETLRERWRSRVVDSDA